MDVFNLRSLFFSKEIYIYIHMFLQVMLCKGRLAQLEQVLKNIKVYTTLKKIHEMN